MSEIRKALEDILVPSLQKINERLTVIEEQLKPLGGRLDKVENKLDRMTENITEIRERLVRVEATLEAKSSGGEQITYPSHTFLKEDENS